MAIHAFHVGDHVEMSPALTAVVHCNWAQHPKCKRPWTASYRGGSAHVDAVDEHKYPLTFLDNFGDIFSFHVARGVSGDADQFDGDSNLTLKKPAA